eukprot:NODE_1_length_95616_cov_0.657642.p78 type:complete len:107 gc:universal NODE_1_length_95616_cov_0.657642:5062-5382(+)
MLLGPINLLACIMECRSFKPWQMYSKNELYNCLILTGISIILDFKGSSKTFLRRRNCSAKIKKLIKSSEFGYTVLKSVLILNTKSWGLKLGIGTFCNNANKSLSMA